MSLDVDPGKVMLVIGLTLLIVIGVNVLIYFSVTRKGTIGQIELMRRAANQARNPWEVEDNSLSELSRLVADLKKNPDPDQDEDQTR
jgi:hypothetical protein